MPSHCNETATRFDYADPAFEHGIREDFSIDQSKHSLFGASKVAADVMVQEYGTVFQYAHLLPARRLSHRAQPLGRGAARIPQLSDQVQRRRPRI